MFDQLINQLKIQLARPLPGWEAQLLMAPKHRFLPDYIPNPAHARQSAVLLLFYPVDNNPNIAFIKRPDDQSMHSGQISFPGGRYEDEDKSLVDTALRETYEEIGAPVNAIDVLGTLTPLYIPVSNYSVQPVVGYCNTRPNFVPNEHEVAGIIEVQVSDLIDTTNNVIEKISVRGFEIEAPCYKIDGTIIWGATAMILSEFCEMGKTSIENE